jgi:hypothetical protein
MRPQYMPAIDRVNPQETATDWLRDGHRIVVATLVERFGSAPLDPKEGYGVPGAPRRSDNAAAEKVSA